VAQLRLRDLIKRRPITVSDDATIHDIIKIMAREDIGFLIVMEGEHVVGVLSERDVIKALAEEGDLRKRVGEFCKRDIIKLRADSTLEEAAQTMKAQDKAHRRRGRMGRAARSRLGEGSAGGALRSRDQDRLVRSDHLIAVESSIGP